MFKQDVQMECGVVGLIILICKKQILVVLCLFFFFYNPPLPSSYFVACVNLMSQLNYQHEL